MMVEKVVVMFLTPGVDTMDETLTKKDDCFVSQLQQNSMN